ncbi:MAG: hypothetical protein JWP56_1200 [Aeromicrobium sp.]|nr:hypothetical protein [Aeromicrobium sp.]
MRRLLAGAVVVAMVIAGLGACASSEPERTAPDRCSTGRPLDVGTTTRTVVVGGVTRTYVQHVPPGYDPTARTPLVMLFHGLGGDPRAVVRTTGMAQAADERTAILVAPLGSGKVSHWDFRSPMTEPTSDLAFVRTLVKELRRDGCIDSSRTYAAGFSNGSALTLALACDGSTDFAAYAAVSGPYFTPDCASAPPASIVYFHGMKDRTVPYEGATTVVGRLPAVNDTMSMWASHDGCPASGATTTASDDLRHYSWTSCRDATAVDIYAIVDGVHGWPGGGPMSPGRTSRTEDSPVDATRLIWEFFDRHPAGGQ